MQDKLGMQLTMVAHYGSKPPELVQFIRMLQDKLSANLLSAFRPYEMDQVHGTIIGLEAEFIENDIVSIWHKKNRDKQIPVNLSSFVDFIKNGDIPEIEIRIGSYRIHSDYPFQSRNQHPYIRSFSVQGEIAVAMGWPIGISDYPKSLFELRKHFEKFNFCHKWHKNEYEDNDFFLVLGRIDKKVLNPSILDRTSEEIRNILSGLDVRIPISRETLSCIAYLDTQLPLATSRQIRFNDSRINETYLKNLYRQEVCFHEENTGH